MYFIPISFPILSFPNSKVFLQQYRKLLEMFRNELSDFFEGYNLWRENMYLKKQAKSMAKRKHHVWFLNFPVFKYDCSELIVSIASKSFPLQAHSILTFL